MKKIIKKMLRGTKRLLDKTVGTIIDEYYWTFRSKTWAQEYLSKKSLNHPHRKFLIGKIAEHKPFDSVLEVGCASGPNLYLLAKAFPKTKLYGTDINRNAIRAGRSFFKLAGINSLSLCKKSGEFIRVLK